MIAACVNDYGAAGTAAAVTAIYAAMGVRQLRRGRAVGAMHVFRGAGIVLSCPHCDNALMKIVEGGSRMWMDFGGMRTLEIAH